MRRKTRSLWEKVEMRYEMGKCPGMVSCVGPDFILYWTVSVEGRRRHTVKQEIVTAGSLRCFIRRTTTGGKRQDTRGRMENNNVPNW